MTRHWVKRRSAGYLLAAALGAMAFVSVADADERVLAETPVRIVTSSDPDMFPKSWRTAPILASGESLSDAQGERVCGIVARAASKYPPEVLAQNLKGVYVLSQLRYTGVVTSGTNSRTTVYLKIGDEAQGFTDAQIESVFHAEFSSILVRNYADDFDAQAWQAVNPPGFRYLGSGVDAIKQGKAGLRPDESLHERGFFKEYSQSTMENDLNGFAAMLFSGDEARWAAADKHPRLQQKLTLALAFYAKIDPAFTEERFREFVER